MEESSQTSKNEKILQDIDNLFVKVKELKEKGNELVKCGNYEEAEKIYISAIQEMEKFKPTEKFEVNKNDEYEKKGLEIIELMKQLYSNLSLCQNKLGKIDEALKNTQYILNTFDPYHDKSYIRILKYLIAVGQLEQAKDIADEIKLKFLGDKIDPFKQIFIQLDQQLSFKNKVKEEKNNKSFNYINIFYIIGGLVSVLGITYSISRYFKKN